MSRVVFTVITSQKDDLKNIQNISNDWDYLCFTDNPRLVKHPWRAIKLPHYAKTGRHNSRLPKIKPHEFIDAKYSIYLDGSIQLISDPCKLVECLGNQDIAFFKHPWRNCIYKEGNEIIRKKLADEKSVENQLKNYRNDAYPEDYGLINGQVIVRRHTKKINVVNNDWWHEFNNGVKRDQLSFNYVAWKNNLKWSVIPGDTYSLNDFVRIFPHAYPTCLNMAFIKKILKNGLFRFSNLKAFFLYLKYEKNLKIL